MKALVYTGRDGLKCLEVADPKPTEAQVLLRVTNCGICGSDLFFYKSGVLPAGAVIGHELSGVIEKTGSGIKGLNQGDRVIARPAGCGKCKWCLAGMENLCADRRSIGLGKMPGGFAEFMAADEDMIIPVPESLPLDQACMADQLGSALHGIRGVCFQPGETAMVMGAGPIGLCAIMLLKYLGAAKITAVEMLENRMLRAEKFGADVVISPEKQPLASSAAKIFGDRGLDCIIECSGNPAAVLQAIQIAPAGCRISLVGMCTKPVTFIPFVVFQKSLTIIGSFANTQAECRECMDIMASGRVPSAELITKKVKIQELPDAFDELLKSKDQIKVMMEC